MLMANTLLELNLSRRLARETGADAMAISIGNVHLNQHKSANLDETALRAIEAVTDVPLVIHGGSGVSVEQRTSLAATSAICKFNIGTELRQSFGRAVRTALETNPDLFDRIAILKSTEADTEMAARAALRALGASASLSIR